MYNFLTGYNFSSNHPPVGEEAKQLLGSLQEGFKLFYIDGSEVSEKESFLQTFSNAMHFPDYFGKNWDAFEECITDLSWLEFDILVLLYKDANLFANNRPDEFNVAMTILVSASKYWLEKKRPMHVFLTASNPTFMYLLV